MMEPVSEWAVINHPMQPWVLKAHIVTSPLLVFAIGLIAMDHIWKQWRLGIRAGRRSGVAAMWVFGPMVVSGYLIQAVTTPGWLSAFIWLHVLTGLGYLAGLSAHQLVVPKRRGRRRAREADLTVVQAMRDSPATIAARAAKERMRPRSEARRDAS